jgi:hypothetical protein
MLERADALCRSPEFARVVADVASGVCDPYTAASDLSDDTGRCAD